MDEIFERHSVREYMNKPVEPEKIRHLLEAAMTAPTAGNQREWEFIVVTQKSMLEALGKVHKYSGCVAQAPLAIVVLADTSGARFPEYWQQDCAASTQNILLEAVSLGLGGVWMGIAPVEERMRIIGDIFNLPHNIKPFAIISLGYPARDNRPSHRFEPCKVHMNGYQLEGKSQ